MCVFLRGREWEEGVGLVRSREGDVGGRREGGIDGWMHACIHAWMDGWMIRWMERSMDG